MLEGPKAQASAEAEAEQSTQRDNDRWAASYSEAHSSPVMEAIQELQNAPEPGSTPGIVATPSESLSPSVGPGAPGFSPGLSEGSVQLDAPFLSGSSAPDQLDQLIQEGRELATEALSDFMQLLDAAPEPGFSPGLEDFNPDQLIQDARQQLKESMGSEFLRLLEAVPDPGFTPGIADPTQQPVDQANLFELLNSPVAREIMAAIDGRGFGPAPQIAAALATSDPRTGNALPALSQPNAAQVRSDLFDWGREIADGIAQAEAVAAQVLVEMFGRDAGQAIFDAYSDAVS